MSTPIHLEVALDRLPLAADETRALTSLTVHESADRSTAVTLVFTGRDPLGQRPARLGDPRFQVGAVVSVALGSPPRPVMLGDIARTRAELVAGGGASLTLEGYGLRHRLGRAPETQTWADETDSGIAARIARKHRLVPRGEPTQMIHRRLEQVDQTDLEFLAQRAAAIDFDVWVDGDQLWFAPVERRGGLLVTLAAADLLAFEDTTDSTDLLDTVHAAWADPGTGRHGLVTVRAEELGDPLSVRLRQRWGYKALWLSGAPSALAARKAATARLAESIDAHRTISATSPGRPDLRVGTHVALTGLGPDQDGELVVVDAVHSVTSGEYRTAFTARRTA